MDLNSVRSPRGFLTEMIGTTAHDQALGEWESHWEKEGRAISAAVDRAGTPWVKMFDAGGKRVDEILYAPEYWRLLKKGYASGVIWRAFQDHSLLPSFLLIYATSFYDCGLTCPYTVSLSTAVPLSKYGDAAVKERFLDKLLRRDDSVWQGATWMTEIRGGSDLGAGVETIAERQGASWRLTGDKYFASNAGAELAVVAGRPHGAPEGVRGLALFLVPRYHGDGGLNYTIRRLKDKIATRSVPTGEVELRRSEAYLLGRAEEGIYLILEVLNISRVSNSLGSVALAQRAMADALQYAETRIAFGKRILEHPMLKAQFEERLRELRACFALAWEAGQLLNEVWQERPPYSPRYHLFRLVAHLAKYHTAEFAVQTAKWCMEVHGGLGVLEEFGVERWLREAMILAIWEGTAHRQMLDALEVVSRKQAHHELLKHLQRSGSSAELGELVKEIDALLKLPEPERERAWEPLAARLARQSAETLLQRMLTRAEVR
ncbi:MAG TPA: acyl-CoA dehydrogenase family protein [Candidatus Angelobacter sp.]|nr:acyl-CoA dehydrogenase family protein [Candidatus Angelobacter sp.]